MGRLSAVITAASLLALATPTRAAELTRVATAAEPDTAFNLDLSVRWERTQKRATITREKATGPTLAEPLGRVADLPELSYSEITNVIIPRVAAGLYQDVELHFELPYYLGQEVTWKYASGINLATESAVSSNSTDANGGTCATTPCPLFPAQVRDTTVYHGGLLGDLKVGLAWGIFNDRKDATKPFWLVGVDVTFPTAALYDPWAGRALTAGTYPSPYMLPTHQAAVGQKIWKFDLQTALSKRMGPIDPYFKAHLTLPRRFSSTYSNCDHVGDAAPGTPPGTLVTAANCALPQWKDAAGAELPWNTGLIFGVELVPLEDRAEGQRLVIDLRATAEYTSKGRWYNELTDATGKLLSTGSYAQIGGLVSFLFRASKHVAVQGQAAYAWETPHLLTGEPLGTNAAGVNVSTNQNPNFDWRWDAPGRRFRISGASVLTFQVNGILSF